MLIDGIHVPLATPFFRDGRCDLRKMKSNVAHYSLSPVAGLVALGPGSEAASLTEQETHDVLQAVGVAAAREKVLVAGITGGSVSGALALAAEAERAGFDALLLAAPADWRELSAAEIQLYFTAVADEASLPVLLWSDAYELPVKMIAELARHRNVIGLYDAGLSFERYESIAAATSDVRREVQVTAVFAPVTRRMASQGEGDFVPLGSLGRGMGAASKAVVKTRSKTVGFQVMAASGCSALLPLLQGGVAGAMPPLAASAPQACYEVYAAFKDGDEALSAEKASRLVDADDLVTELGVAAVKYGCDLNGYGGGPVRLPRVGLNAEQRVQMDAVMREARS